MKKYIVLVSALLFNVISASQALDKHLGFNIWVAIATVKLERDNLNMLSEPKEKSWCAAVECEGLSVFEVADYLIKNGQCKDQNDFLQTYFVEDYFSADGKVAERLPQYLINKKIQPKKIDRLIVYPIHIVYSPASYGEDTTRRSVPEKSEEIGVNNQNLSNDNYVMTFAQQKTATRSSSDKKWLLGDDGTTFYDSYAMKFAHLGQSLSVVSYPGKPKKVSQSVLYTQPAVEKLTEHLFQRVIVEKRNRILFVGPCIGGSIGINCLKKLVNFNATYFANTSLKTQEQANQILQAINNGGFIAIDPLLSIEKHNFLAVPAALLSGVTLATATLAAYCYGFDGALHYCDETALKLLGAGLLSHIAIGTRLKSIYTKMIRYCIVPLLTLGNYNPWHEDPIDGIEALQGKITGPVDFNFTTQDWVMQWDRQDILGLCNAFPGNNVKIKVTSDRGHCAMSPQFMSQLNKDFNKRASGKANNVSMPSNKDKAVQLEKAMHSKKGIVYRLWRANKWALGFVLLCMTSILCKTLYYSV